jgi:hypothetical protein
VEILKAKSRITLYFFSNGELWVVHSERKRREKEIPANAKWTLKEKFSAKDHPKLKFKIQVNGQ